MSFSAGILFEWAITDRIRLAPRFSCGVGVEMPTGFTVAEATAPESNRMPS